MRKMSKKREVILGNMLEVLDTIEENSIDAIVCDPPYEINFMGRGWDNSGVAFQKETWEKCLRVLKPGGYLVAFGACRTSHRITCAIEDAGFEIRDTLQWVFGSGFPKSLDVGKAIDKDAGAVREVLGISVTPFRVDAAKHRGRSLSGAVDGSLCTHTDDGYRSSPITAPATDLARQWHGYGTALKPAHEPITLARKPLSGTVARNVSEWGTGGIDVDGCRVGDGVSTWPKSRSYAPGQIQPMGHGDKQMTGPAPDGRWPPNIILGDGAGEVIDGMAPKWPSRAAKPLNRGGGGGNIYGSGLGAMVASIPPMSGNASEFFPTFCYVPKASRKEREAGLEEAGIEPLESGIRNNHPTVKPVAIMQWLVKLVSPPRDLDPVVLDPFCGSGTTGIACVHENVRFIGIEMEERHAAIARARIAHAEGELSLEDLNELFG